MINHEHKFIFIHIPKCAGISVGKTLTELTINVSHRRKSNEEIQNVMNNLY